MDSWPKLRPLLVVTGALSFRQVGEAQKSDRNTATVIVAKFRRRLARIALFETPFGTIVLAARLKEARKLFRDTTHEVTGYNTGRTCQLDNFLLWERLEGNRRVAVEGWEIGRASCRGRGEISVG